MFDRTKKLSWTLTVALALLTVLAGAPMYAAAAPHAAKATVVTLDSPSPMIAVKIMVRAGSANDPAGKEGLAALTADALVEGGFGSADNPVTKEKLATITQPWGDDAMPRAQVAAETTTFHMTIPRDVFAKYLDEVLRPMFASPLFQESEIARLKNEANAQFSAARYEDLETLGLSAIDEYVNEGTAYAHQPFGSEESVPKLTRADVVDFFQSFYRPGDVIVGVSTSDKSIVDPVVAIVNGLRHADAPKIARKDPGMPKMPEGRRAVVIEEPNAPAASVHLGFPLPINRTSDDFWPLYVANVWFGTHRDSFSHLYSVIRQERGYNYGDYSYIEHWNGRPFSLFQIFNQPRHTQYFSIWLRPVAPEYAYHLAKAATWELDNLVRNGLTDDEVTAAKNKAKVLYVNLAETVNRLLAARMDDAFYGMSPGFLDGYLARVDKVTPEQVNAAIRKYLQTKNVKYVIVTDAKHSKDLVAQIEADQPGYGKSLADYQFTKVKLDDGAEVWQIPEGKIDMLRKDALWANTPLDIGKVRFVPVTALFRTGAFVAESE